MTSLSVCLPSRRREEREERQKKKILSLRPPPPCLSHDTKNPCTILPQSLSASSPADMLSSPPSPPSCSLAAIVTAMLEWGRGARGANYKREHGRETRRLAGGGREEERRNSQLRRASTKTRRDAATVADPAIVVALLLLTSSWSSSSIGTTSHHPCGGGGGIILASEFTHPRATMGAAMIAGYGR